ncbi:MAG TPA: putative sugar nucleotidyl transferase, partial [Chitinophagales bacterium]|nr:putative sugar nucleotidyl transferase [Chitinophagales bacterium]
MPIQHLVLFDGFHRNNLLPIVATRAVADIRIGILTIREKWECLLSLPVYILTADYLRAKYAHPPVGHTTFINATVLPQQDWLDAV